MEKKLPQAIESGIYDKDLVRRRNEGMLQYTIRRDKLFKQLTKEGWEVPSLAKGYILLRDAHLPEKARDLIEMWTSGVYEYAEIQKYLKRLERPVPGAGGTRITGLVGFEEEPADDLVLMLGNEEESTHLAESLFLLPGSFDEEALQECSRYLDDPDVIFVAQDLSEHLQFEEDEAVAILANYGQVREYLSKQKLGRGFTSAQKPGAKGKGKSGPRALMDRVPPPPTRTGGNTTTARPKRWSRTSLMSRTKCARCGQVGHWARTCTNPPDERGKRRQGAVSSTLFASTQLGETPPAQDFQEAGSRVEDPAASQVENIGTEGRVENPAAFVLFIYALVEAFVGINLAPGLGLLDTGAQHGVIGQSDYDKLCIHLSKFGLKPRELPPTIASATGVGGKAMFNKCAQVPIGIQGICGIVTLHVMSSEVPLLLPMSFCRRLGMVLDTNNNTADWRTLHCVSDVVTTKSEHIAINITEFPKGGWKNPHHNPKVVSILPPDLNIQQSDFECPFTLAVVQPELLKPQLACENSTPVPRPIANAEQSMPHPPEQREPVLYRSVWKRGRLGKLIECREVVHVETPPPQNQCHVPDAGHAGQDQNDLGGKGVRCPIPDGTPEAYGPKRSAGEVPLHQRAGGGPSPTQGPRKEGQHQSPHGPSDVPSPRKEHDGTRQCQDTVVDVPSVSEPLGEARPSRGDDPDRDASGSGPCDLRKVHGEHVPRSTPGCNLLQLDHGHHGKRFGNDETREFRTVPAPGPVYTPPPGGGNVGGRRFRPGNVNQMLAAITLGVVAHVASAGSAIPNLEGPVFGKRVGTYPLHELGHIQFNRENASLESKEAPLRVTLYRPPCGAVEHSNAEDHSAPFDSVGTVPSAVKRMLLKAAEMPDVWTLPATDTKAFPLSTPAGLPPIPEDQPAWNQPPVGPSEDDQVLPGEEPQDEADMDAAPLSDEEIEAPRADFHPTRQQLIDLKIAHDNSGHPSPSDFARMIKLGNGKPELVRWVKHNFKCDDCEANKRPKSRRPSAVPKTYRFNHVVGIDLLEAKDPDGIRCFHLNVLCWGTSFQQVKIVCGDNTKTAENVWNTFLDTWVRVFGLPDILVLDPGTEFEGAFTEWAQAYGITILPCDRESPWQNGRTERAGGLWKEQLKIASRESTPVTRTEWTALGALCVQARNRFQNRSGYSPTQRVFGISQRLPNSLLSDDAIDPALLSENPMTDFQRAEEMRASAQKAWAELDSRTRMKRALGARHRIAHNFSEGQLVFVWRQPRVGPGKWIGPGLIILPTAGGCWVNMRGSLWRCSNEQLRPATNDENLGAELVNRYLGEMRWDLQRNKGPKKFVDVRAEGIPDFGESLDTPDSPRQDSEMPEPEAAPSSGSPQPQSEPNSLAPSVPGTPTGRERSRSPVLRYENDEDLEEMARLRARSVAWANDPTDQRGTSPAWHRPREEAPHARAAPGTPVGRLLNSFGTEFQPNMPDSRNLYVEAKDFSAENVGGGSFFAEEAYAEFETEAPTSCVAHQFFAVKKKPVDAEISTDRLPAEAKSLFTDPTKGSRRKEWENMIAQYKADGGPAVKVHRGAEARKRKEKYPHRMIPSRWLEKWKDMGDDFNTPLSKATIQEAQVPTHHGAKSRWILQGFHDPDISILRRSVPTPETSDVPLCAQMLASLRARAWVGDVKGAFSQGLRNQRSEPLFATPPPGGIPGEDDDIVIEILAEIYGLISGPPGWRRSLFTTFKEVGFKSHPLAPCVVVFYEELHGKPDQFSGLVCVETDDLLGGGVGPKYQAAILALRENYKFGKWKDLMENSTEYGGRTLKQLPSFDILISMSRYLQDKCIEIKLERGRGKDQKALANAGEITQMRGICGKLNWASREGMPQGSGDASLLASRMPNPTVEDLTEANAAMRRLKANDVPVWIRSIPFENMSSVLFEDASLANNKGGAAQVGHLVCVCEKKIHKGERAKTSVLLWKSHKNRRACPSTLLNEATGMSEGLADCEWVTSWIGLCKNLHYDLRKRHLLNREIKIVALTTCHDYSELDLAAVTDAKSLFDNLMQEQYTGAEKRAALEICVIRDSLEGLGGKARWVPHDRNPADCLTKLKGNVDALLKLLREGSYVLVEEADEMAQRKLYRETTGKKKPSPKRVVGLNQRTPD